jgi:K+-transporting ATPase ATPase C chain
MRKTLISSALAVVVFTILLGLAYPLAMTGAGQVLFPHQANGSQITSHGKVVGSSLLAQDFGGKRAGRYFQPRPSVTGYSPSATYFANQGPNQKDTLAFYREQIAGYLKREGPYNRGLTAARIPIDAVTYSASGVDPLISKDNAEIQAPRVAAVRGLSPARVRALIDDHTSGRFLGFVGESGVNVTELNLALDSEAR